MNTIRHSWRRLSHLFHRHLRPTSSLSSTTFHSQTLSLSSSFSPRHFNFPANFLHDFSKQSFKLFCSESSSSSEIRRCWNCNSSPTTSQLFLVCDSCRCIQPVDRSVDYFRIFGLRKRQQGQNSHNTKQGPTQEEAENGSREPLGAGETASFRERKYDIEESSLEGLYKDWQKKLHPDLVHSKSESEKEYAAEQSSRIIDAFRTLKNSLSRAIYLMKLHGVHVDEEQTVSDPELLAEVHERLKQWSNTFAGAFESQDTNEALNAIRRMTYYIRANEEIVKRL
ncbi:uncharacterized protein LOC110735370 isoform X2 [Chenopodium quinoa]|uniref:uncharacterized protein LOC110735370 isoform X2 n=1 Tax=Chenopodium quinoa TaxID=63459 RepID=UPI000B78451C|nr:uncharacterized protein LOC110735370 isoform X2 [Chenopodium quinoa]